VLLLYGEARALPAALDIDEAIRGRFRAADFEVRFFTEYLDLSWTSDPRYLERLRAFLASKYLNRRIDVIMTMGAPALRFALENRAALFAGVPIIFTAVPPGGAVPMGGETGVTGVWMAAEAAATVDAARRLQPQARRLVVVAGRPRRIARSSRTSGATSRGERRASRRHTWWVCPWPGFARRWPDCRVTRWCSTSRCSATATASCTPRVKA
jgi:hypothetical protein